MRLFGGLILVFSSFAAAAQHTNSWINFSQKYFKLNTAKDGIYQLTFQDLRQAGFPVESVDPRLIQLFHRGKEQAILIKHNQQPADDLFEDGEYLEFYGRKNDGTLDAGLYYSPGNQPHNFYNLYSDTTAYFLTWSSQVVPGKRMEAIDLVNSTGLAKETFHTRDLLSVFTSEYAGGATFSEYIQQSFFDQGEGWTGNVLCTVNTDCAAQEQDFSFNQLTQSVQSGGLPRLEVQVVGRDNLLHRSEIYVGPNTGSLRLVTSQNFTDFQVTTAAVDLSWSDVASDGRLIVRVKAVGVGGGRDRFSISYVRIKFPEGYDLAGATEKILELPSNALGKSYIELPNAPAGARLFDITDPNEVATVGTRLTGGVLSALVPNTTAERKILVNSQVLQASQLRIQPVSFRAIDPTHAKFIVVSHKNLMQGALGMPDVVKAYAGYRASAEGGGYDTLTIAVDQLYNQFNYGETSPLAIREFMRYMVDEGQPEFLFLIGKGREIDDAMYRRTSFPGNELRELVPTAGFPSSDMLFTAGLKGETHIAAVATGRLTASVPAQVATYLTKVMDFEKNASLADWNKNILHLSGGISQSDLANFRTFMDGFAAVAKGPYLGGQVETIGKHDPNPIQFIDISTEINKGANLVTFFGHSAPNSTDIDIGYVTDPKLGFNNAGKYPVFIVNGCSAGQFFGQGTNFGEDWMLAPNKGARGFMANSSFGISTILRLYTQTLYEVAFADPLFINKSVAQLQQEVGRRLLNRFGTSPILISQIQQMVFLGDPAMKLFTPNKPDLEIDNSSVFLSTFDGKAVHALADSIQLNIITKNRGLALDSSLYVRVRHQFDDGTVLDYDRTFAPVLSEDTLRFVIKRGSKNFFGNNELSIKVDAPDSIAELNEGNNEAVWTGFIPFNGTKNLLPPDFAIISALQQELIFQNTDLLAPPLAYQIELDSSANFDSPFLKKKEVEGPVLSRVSFSLPDKDSTTYYWRTRVKNQLNAQWEVTSFSYVRNSDPGWGQLDSPQFSDNNLNGLVQDATSFKVEFKSTSVDVFVRTFGSTNGSASSNGSFQINNSEYYFSPQAFDCRNNTINLVAFNKSTLVPYRGVPFTFVDSHGRACGKEPQILNSFLTGETDTGNQDDLIQYVDNVQAGDSVVLFSMGDAGFLSWTTAVKNKLGELGILAADIDSFLPGEPVIILAKKGATPGTAKIIKSSEADPSTQELQLHDQLTGRIPNGSMRSTVIGPALKWNSISTRLRELELTDHVQINILGITLTGAEQELISDLPSSRALDEIDANNFPYLRLTFHTDDEVNLTPAFIKNWIVSFDPAPEGIIFIRDSAPSKVQEGAPWSADFGFINISNASFSDSLRVETELFTTQTRRTESKQFYIKPPAPGDSTLFEVAFNTTNKVGLNDLSLFVNRNILIEQYYPNNALTLADYLEVTKDQVSPVLDVTIDGRHVENGDFVSKNPLISIKVIDENQYLIHSDTSAVELLLQFPCSGCDATPVYFKDNNNLSFTKSGNGVFIANYTPKDLEPGLYTLFVQASDVSGNYSGEDFYEIDFQVSTEDAITFHFPYPNPSAAGFFFDWIVSGPEVPTSVQLQIFNPQGQVVSSFSEADMPGMHVGTNRVKWDTLVGGKKSLPDGIYFYRFIVRTAQRDFSSSGRLSLAR